MNPPSVIHGAMSRDRKPFTYTPGGLDLSEIKSERMAKRLMRNAMNQGVSEVSAQPMQSPPMPSSPVIVPNFNCLPVQVFPTFNLPANPKSLLRTRSHPDQPREPLGKRNIQPQFENSNKTVIDTNDICKNSMTSHISNNRPASMYEYSSIQGNNYLEPISSYISTEDNKSTLPERSKDEDYLRMLPKTDQIITDTKVSTEAVDHSDNINNVDTVINMPISDTSLNILLPITKPVQENTGNITQREVKVKKTVKKEQRTIEERNGNQNGDLDAELTVKLPTKKPGAQIETTVAVENKILPDGSIEEVKTITTKTTIDGKTEINTKTESRILSEEEAEAAIEEVEEEEVEEEEEEQEDTSQEATDKKEKQLVTKQENNVQKTTINANAQDKNIIKTEEKSETTVTTTKKVVVVQSDNEETEEVEEEVEEEEQIEEEEEEIEEVEPVTTVSIKNPEKISTPPPEVTETETDEGKAEVKDDVNSETKKDAIHKEKEQVEEKEIKPKVEQDSEKTADDSVNKEQGTKIKEQDQQDEEIYEEAEETAIEKDNKTEKQNIPDVEENGQKEELSTEQVVSEKVIPIETEKPKEEQPKTEIVEQKSETKIDEKQDIQYEKSEEKPQIKTNIPLREPSIPLEKIEDIEIKPIAPAGVVTKTHTEKTEIITSSSDQPPGVHSTQTEYNRIENIVTVNRTTKTLDNTYENLAQNEIPTVKTYFTPSRILSSPMTTSPYQPVYPPVSTERRHSLLLDRLSVDRQMPSEIYHNQNYEQQGQVTQEPQSEILTISNVKPSKITNQQWYQQSKESVYNNVTSTPLPSEAPSWTQPKAQPQTTYKPQPTYQPPQSYQPQPTYQSQQSYQPQPTYQPQQTYQTQQSYPPQQTYPPQPTPQSQYQPSYVDSVQTNKYSTFTPKPVNRVSSLDTTPSLNASTNLYSYNNDSSEIYQKSTQQYSSSYVPPPWEQDSSYIADSNQNYYQSSTTGTINTTPTPAESWKPTLPKGKFSKPPPTAYIPPAPNQSFVKPVSSVEPSKQSGRKTYYSEYERRYISVPESTYIPHETKFQPQPDPSPKYYYDNTETNETVEHQWRKELREFTEKTSQTQTQSEQANVKPPWESDPKYTKTTDQPYTPTPTWSQTVRPRSWRERSFESEFVGSQEWPKTNTLGRGRPLHSYNINEPISERPRGVSVDRYNPNSYKPVTSLEHPPVQTHTLPTPAPHGTYHNPNVPAYHSRASDEIREQPASYKQPRVIREQRASPFQSRSFKYLQWITGTED